MLKYDNVNNWILPSSTFVIYFPYKLNIRRSTIVSIIEPSLKIKNIDEHLQDKTLSFHDNSFTICDVAKWRNFLWNISKTYYKDIQRDTCCFSPYPFLYEYRLTTWRGFCFLRNRNCKNILELFARRCLKFARKFGWKLLIQLEKIYILFWEGAKFVRPTNALKFFYFSPSINVTIFTLFLFKIFCGGKRGKKIKKLILLNDIKLFHRCTLFNNATHFR